MDDLISKLSEIRSNYDCFDETEEPYYRALSTAIKKLSEQADGDTISRQAAIDAYGDWYVEEGTEEGFIGTVKQLLEGLPSAQSEPEELDFVQPHKKIGVRLEIEQPEIIRCKDCKYWDTTWQNDWAKNYHYCPITDGTHRDDWYCADAERREE